jgi:UDP-2,3-diacylglucosamine pyrophosphatase LpxH
MGRSRDQRSAPLLIVFQLVHLLASGYALNGDDTANPIGRSLCVLCASVTLWLFGLRRRAAHCNSRYNTRMKLHILSDLHLEFRHFDLPHTDADAIVIAGDLCPGLEGIEYLRQHAQKPVIYIAGNHEYYGHAFPRLTEQLRAAAAGSLVHFLQDTALVLHDIRFLACTLWTDFQLFGPAAASVARAQAADCMMDYRHIRHSPTYRHLTPLDTQAAHQASMHWLESALAKPFPGPTVVVSHTAPSIQSLAPRWHSDPVSAAFASNLEALIHRHPVPLWIHGHTHHCVDYHIAQTRILSNQRGYPHENTGHFDPGLVITIP